MRITDPTRDALVVLGCIGAAAWLILLAYWWRG